jgi:hypothetical protein
MPAFPHNNYLSLAVTALMVSTSTCAQGSEDAIARCSSSTSVEDRIACLESALRQPSADTVAEEIGAPKAVPVVSEDDDEGQQATSADASETAASATDEMVSGTTDEAPMEMEAAPAAATGGTVAAETGDAVTPELGAEQINDLSTPKTTRIPTTVVRFQLVGTGRLRFTLDNGQVWQQTGDDDANIHRKLRHYETVPSEMWQARSGGYRIYLTPIDRTVRVRRLK